MADDESEIVSQTSMDPDPAALEGVLSRTPMLYPDGSAADVAKEFEKQVLEIVELLHRLPDDQRGQHAPGLTNEFAGVKFGRAADPARARLAVAARCMRIWDEPLGYRPCVAAAASIAVRTAYQEAAEDGDVRAMASVLHVALLARLLAEDGAVDRRDARRALLDATELLFGQGGREDGNGGFARLQAVFDEVAGLGRPAGPVARPASSPAAARSEATVPMVVVAPGLDLGAQPDNRSKAMAAYSVLGDPLPLAGVDMDPEEVVAAIGARTPWAGGLAEHVRGELRIRRFAGHRHIQMKPILLVGPPGSGKSALARTLSAASGLPMERVDAGGRADAMDLMGSAAGWANAQPGRAASAIARAQCPNPILFVDEVDKISVGSRNGSIASALLSMLEPGTAARYFDECLRTEVDLSYVTWILAANDIRRVPPPLLSRVKVVHVGRPGPRFADQAIRSVAEGIAKDLGIDPALLPDIPPVVMAQARRLFAMRGGADLRRVRSALEAVISHGIDEAMDRRFQH